MVQEEPRGPSQLIEIPIPANQQKVKLPDVQQLRSTEGQTIIIKSIRLITPKVLTNGMTVAGTNVNLANLQLMCLTLYSQGWEKGQLIPLLVLNDVVDGDSAAATTIPYRNKTTRLNNWRNVDWSQSFLQWANGTQSDAAYVCMLEVEYVKLDANGKTIIGPS